MSITIYTLLPSIFSNPDKDALRRPSGEYYSSGIVPCTNSYRHVLTFTLINIPRSLSLATDSCFPASTISVHQRESLIDLRATPSITKRTAHQNMECASR